MTILILGAFGSGALEHYYLDGLAAAGATLDQFDITKDYYGSLERSIFNKAINKVNPAVFFQPINTAVLKFVEGKNYDVILVFKGLTLFPETLAELKRHTRLLTCYNPDHPFKFFSEGSGNKNVLHGISLYDVYFTYAVSVAKELNTRYHVKSFTVPFGYDHKSITVKPAIATALLDKWLFIGAYDPDRAAFLKALKEEYLYIYGDSKWRSRNRFNSLITTAFQGRALYGEDYKTAIASGLGVFNLLRKQNIEEGSHNMRTFEVPGYGGLLIANRTEEQQAFFEENKEAIYFDSVEELKDKLSYFNRKPSEAEKMKQAARERSVRSNYSYRHRSESLYNILSQHL